MRASITNAVQGFLSILQPRSRVRNICGGSHSMQRDDQQVGINAPVLPALHLMPCLCMQCDEAEGVARGYTEPF